MAKLTNLPEGAWIVLGFLLDGEGPRSGYDLQAQAARSVADFWPVTKAHVYTALPRLEDAGFVASQHVGQSGVPDKRMYSPTAEGAAAFETWLNETDLSNARLRHPVLVKTFFGSALHPGVFTHVLDRHEARCIAEIDRYAALASHRGAATLSPDARYRRLAIRHGILSLQAELEWIAEARTFIGSSSDDNLHMPPTGEQH